MSAFDDAAVTSALKIGHKLDGARVQLEATVADAAAADDVAAAADDDDAADAAAAAVPVPVPAAAAADVVANSACVLGSCTKLRGGSSTLHCFPANLRQPRHRVTSKADP